jgi:hypothetical protein
VISSADLEHRIRSLDETLLATIESESSANDKRSLLALHAAAGEALGNFVYLEIGSHLGGSLQALVRDPRCDRIVSVDSRPVVMPDQRGMRYAYSDNSTERMLTLLGGLDDAEVGKIVALEASTDAIDPASIGPKPALAFIDGEHTDSAALRDARFCKNALGEAGGVIAFHDSWVVFRAVGAFLGELEQEGVEFHAVLLPDCIVAVEIGPPRLLATEVIGVLVRDGVWGYLESLRLLGAYREALARPLPRFLRRAGLIRLSWAPRASR